MSTKVYEAYKIPISKIGAYKEEFDRQNIKIIEGLIPKLYSTLDEDKAIKNLKEKYFSERDVEDYTIRKCLHAKALLAPYIISKLSRWNEFNLDCWVSFYLKKRYAYVIHGMVGYGKFEPPEWAQDYSYWNNSDKPEHISQKSWNHRGEIWHGFDNYSDKIVYQPGSLKRAFSSHGPDFHHCSLLSNAYDNYLGEDCKFTGNDVMWASQQFAKDYEKEKIENEVISLERLEQILNDIENIGPDEFESFWKKKNSVEKTDLSIEYLMGIRDAWTSFNKGKLSWIIENDTKYGLFYSTQKDRKEENERKTREVDSYLLL